MKFNNVFITGGAGYVGSALVPELLKKGYSATVYDLYIYDYKFPEHPNLRQVKGDIRDRENLIAASKEADAIIHLAAISNDPSFDLNPNLGKSINYDAVHNILDACKENGTKRLIVASSTSQYGIKPLDVQVTEDTDADPTTDYAKYKIETERLIQGSDTGNLEYVFVRPATLCAYAPRLRLDLSVNILTINALINKKIKVFGGDQMRPALHMGDMVRFYELMLEAPKEKIHNQAFNVSYENLTIRQIGELVQKTLNDPSITLEVTPTDDKRSYHINTDKMKKELDFHCQYTLQDAVQSIADAHSKGLIVDGLNNSLYHNIKRMKEIDLK
jgi:nucleoside-diphosphate-sugar epimerase